MDFRSERWKSYCSHCISWFTPSIIAQRFIKSSILWFRLTSKQNKIRIRLNYDNDIVSVLIIKSNVSIWFNKFIYLIFFLHKNHNRFICVGTKNKGFNACLLSFSKANNRIVFRSQLLPGSNMKDLHRKRINLLSEQLIFLFHQKQVDSRVKSGRIMLFLKREDLTDYETDGSKI